jgi:hypothetical protein
MFQQLQISKVSGANVIKLYTAVSYNFLNKLEHLAMASFPANICRTFLMLHSGVSSDLTRKDWKGLPGTNALTSYENL